MDIVSIIIGLLVGLGVGAGVVFFLLKKAIEKQSADLIEEAKTEAEVIKKDKILQAK